MKWILLVLVVWTCSTVQAQEELNSFDETSEEILKADQAASVPQAPPSAVDSNSAPIPESEIVLDKELQSTNAQENATDIPVDGNAAQKQGKESGTVAVDLGPEADYSDRRSFRKPPGPPQGGVLSVPHKGAAQGLLRIYRDGSYQYRTKIRPKSQAVSIRLGTITPPIISNARTQTTYKSMYGSQNLFGLNVDYEWQPFRGFGALGIQLGAGLAFAHGAGTLNLTGAPPSEESFDLYVVPLSAFVIYRFEYIRRQWIVPFANGGLTYYGLAERRDDSAPIQFAGAAAVGGGGGVHFSISRLDPVGAFTLDREYGIADMWLTLEARAMKGLKPDVDFTNQQVSAGITVDF